MKKIFVFLISLVCVSAFGATLVPVQLLNPTGSSSGQAIVSTGASSAPAWGGIGVNGIAAIAANTVLANATGSSAAPTAFAMPSCSAAGNALAYTSGTGITCNTSLFSSPTITTPNITGVTNGGNAAAGIVGEYVTNSTTGTSLPSASNANATSVSLTAGDWDVSGTAVFVPAASTTVSALNVGVSTTSATFPTIGGAQQLTLTYATGVGQQMLAPVVRVSVSTTTTVFMVVQAVFGTSTMTVNGFIRARRVR